jgi:Aspartyl protease
MISLDRFRSPIGGRHSLRACRCIFSCLIVAAAFSALVFLGQAHAASSEQLATNSEMAVFTSADESSAVIESVRDAGSLSPLGEMTGAGGVKWFMVKTKSGNVGWIKASDKIVGTRIDEHFRSLPKDSGVIGPVTSAPQATSAISATGAITIPVRIYRGTVFVPVSFQKGNSTVAANLALDTGAGQTMISRRIASNLRLYAIDSQPRLGIGGTVVADVGVVDLVKVGGAAVKDMPVSIHDFAANRGIDGLLGFDFLGRFQMSVDSEKQVLTLTPQKK